MQASRPDAARQKGLSHARTWRCLPHRRQSGKNRGREPCRADQPRHVNREGIFDSDFADLLLNPEDLRTGEHGFQGIQRIGGAAVFEHAQFGLFIGISEGEPDGEPVELSFRQRICSVIFDRVFGCDDEERLRESPLFSFHGDLSFVHGFEQRGLGPRRCAVDLVREQQVGKDRSFAEEETPLLRRIDGRPENIGGQQIGGELNAPEFRGNGKSERLCESGFSCSGHIFHQDMPVGEKGGQEQIDDMLFSADYGIELPFQLHHLVIQQGIRHSNLQWGCFFQKYNRSSPGCKRQRADFSFCRSADGDLIRKGAP